MGLFDVVDDFFDDPIKTTAKIVTQPLRDSVEVLEGLSDGELRERAIARLGADAIAGMGTAEIIEVLSNLD